jgi:hypothetical protein
MIANHIHDALAQVRTLQAFILERNVFKGYSGKARLVAGGLALAGSFVLAAPCFPPSPWAHLAGWGTILVLSLLANYAAMVYWFLFDQRVRRNLLMLRPALDALPALTVGAVLSATLILHREFDLLFGVWMSLYGLAQVAYRTSLPRGIYLIGLFYLVCGAACLLSDQVRFTSPWPMGLVFFAGEVAGGIILVRDHNKSSGLTEEES